MAIQSISVHGQILEADLTPAVGTVAFRILQELRDTVDNIVLAPTEFVATLDVNGEFTIVLPTTDNPDVTPQDWSYWVYVDTNAWNPDPFYIQLPFALGPVAEFADIIPVSVEPCTPDGTACAPISVVGELDDLSEFVDLVNAQVGILTGQVSVNTGEIATLNTTVGALVGQVNVLSPIVLDNQADIVALQAAVATNSTNITTLQGQVATILANAGLVGPTAFVNLTSLHANIVLGAVPAASRLDRGADNARLRGFLQGVGVAVPAGQVLANIGTVAHRPLHPISQGVRYSGGSNRLQIALNGDITFSAIINPGEQVWLDGFTYDLVA